MECFSLTDAYTGDPVSIFFLLSVLILVSYICLEIYRVTTCFDKETKLHRLKHIELTLLLIIIESMGGIVYININSVALLNTNIYFNIMVLFIFVLNILFIEHLNAELE